MIFPAALELPLSMCLSFLGVLTVFATYINRDRPEWQRDMRKNVLLAVGLVALGFGLAALPLIGH